ncbi:hypothetical protein PHYBLDRAFT_73421 [Phycomyces blakesleeanus NRRL 1555(-)]|uniref:F-box domain-containing protein n=1 Tax=Phycomyces blakesleeanus (strain ATCC 8743b / DSM 1359 / FGSC 10004 / NBRC 33097 / NRRL 1555) TaxID=763407 RepID=A0A162VBR0_PHYB8|nr:hypothetical protein PHYBLDRAFT_73421 [Phycomyces blakesleeanus NRRL 1555(-)]OAD81533.1 hypothetical protein PHYBLDRAFT_73421 [Phycomyces blakesleeanus NRRL 1555(-)]|eukprot:XP_018299573.1 hypothetical protein PHYBLDRAFT_73421 [Phycomyces blakesleeanus NRRL 1555(-)]
MTASELPSEILSQIAEHLLTKDILAGPITCKTWRYIFQYYLWRDIQIDSTDTLEHIYNMIKPYNNTSIPHGSMVHSIQIEQQYDLFQCLPNLVHIDLGHKNLNIIN